MISLSVWTVSQSQCMWSCIEQTSFSTVLFLFFPGLGPFFGAGLAVGCTGIMANSLVLDGDRLPTVFSVFGRSTVDSAMDEGLSLSESLGGGVLVSTVAGVVARNLTWSLWPMIESVRLISEYRDWRASSVAVLSVSKANEISITDWWRARYEKLRSHTDKCLLRPHILFWQNNMWGHGTDFAWSRPIIMWWYAAADTTLSAVSAPRCKCKGCGEERGPSNRVWPVSRSLLTNANFGYRLKIYAHRHSSHFVTLRLVH